jgi:hypothetical protein
MGPKPPPAQPEPGPFVYVVYSVTRVGKLTVRHSLYVSTSQILKVLEQKLLQVLLLVNDLCNCIG